MLSENSKYKMRRSLVSAEGSSRYQTWVQPKWKPFNKNTGEGDSLCDGMTAESLGVTTMVKAVITGAQPESLADYHCLLTPRPECSGAARSLHRPESIMAEETCRSSKPNLRKEWDSYWGTALAVG